jgi:hypothetical protein
VATEAGQVALPALTGLMHGLSDVGGFLASNPGLTKPLVEAGGVLAGVAVAGKVASAGATALSSVGKVAETLHIPGLDKLANVGKGSAAGGMQTAADTNDAAAGKMQVAADTFNAGADKMSVAADESAVASEENLGAPVAAGWVRTGGAALAGEEAAGEEAAVAAGAGLKDGLTRTMGGLFAGGMVGSIAIPASMELDKLIQSRLGNSQASGLAQVGSGAAAGAATGAAAGSVIPGLGTAVGAIAGALIGGVTTALANHKVWDDLVQPPQPAKTPYVYEGPTPTPSPKPHGNAEPTTGQAPSRWADRQPVPAPAAPATFEWQVANRGDWARHTTASDFDHARHDASSVYDWMNSAVNEQAHTTASQFDSARHGVASIGHDIGSLFGWDAPAQKAVPAAPTQQPAQGKGGSWSSVTGGMGGQLKPLKIDAPDMSALTSAKGKAQADAQGITTAIDQALHKPVKMAAPDLATLTAAKGTAQSDGVAISAGLASGITAGGPAAVAAANSVAGQVEAAMAHTLQVRSPSKVTEKIGADTAAGLVVGLESGQTAVSTAAAALASGTAAAWKWSAPTITNTISTLKSDVTAAMKSGTVDASNGSFLTRMLTVDNQTLSSLAQKRYVLEAQIKAADAYAANVQSSAVSSASIVTVAGNITSADSSTTAPAPAASYQASDLISGEQAQLAQIRQFNTQVAQLKKEGLNTTELGQIIQSGAQTGLPIAQAITSGGKGAVAQLNAIQAQTNAAAKQLGITSANSMFESGTQIGAGLVAGLKSDLSGVESAIKTMAQQMVTTLEKELKIKSPSLVFAERGEMIPAGVAAGVVSGTPGAVAAVGRMGSQLGGDFHPGMAYASHGGGPGGGSGSGGGGGNTIINVTVNVAGSVSSQQDLVNAVTKGIRAKGGQNWQTGIIRPGRAG